MDDRSHRHYMQQAVDLAWRGRGWVDPNPMVGCVIVKGGCVIGQGFHTGFGNLHAEREALVNCAELGNDPHGADVYVTLEPCSHYGKTPPCADALIEAGVSRVIVGASDPNPQVAGGGIARLQQAGIEVIEGVCERECVAMNRPFFKYLSQHIPYVVAKYAMTLDGKIATRTGASKWITGDAARAHAHLFRGTYASIMVGVQTVIADDPLLTARTDADTLERTDADTLGRTDADAFGRAPHQPTRVICDTNLRTPLDAQVVTTTDIAPTLIATSVSDPSAHKPYTDAGCGILCVRPGEDGRIDLAELIQMLGEMGIDSVYIEGGSTLFGSAFDARLVDEVHAYVAPKVFGGAAAPGAIGGVGVPTPDDCMQFAIEQIEPVGGDIFIRAMTERIQ